MAEWLTWVLTGALPFLVSVAMVVMLCLLLFRYFAEPFYPGLSLVETVGRVRRKEAAPVVIKESPRRPGYHLGQVVLWVAGLWAVSRALILLIALVGAYLQGDLWGFVRDFEYHWVRWDANHYLGLAENWYVNEGDPRFHIVFYPLYPLTVMIFRFLFMGNTILSAVFVSNICLIVSGVLMYDLVLKEQNRAGARRAVVYLMFCPLSLFYSIPYSEALFLMLCLLSVVLARRRHFGWAVFCGALCAATRSLGVLIAAPVYLEMLRQARERSLMGESRAQSVKRVVGYTLLCCLILAGLGAYLLLNYRVTGNPFQFLIYQSEHWSQRFGNIADTLRYTMEYALNYHDWGTRMGTWIPQAVLMIAVLILMGVTLNRVHPGDGAYAWLYMFMAMAPTWLLSGPRYISAMYALYPMMSMITRRKGQQVAMAIVILLLNIYFVYLYSIEGCVL